MEIIATKLNNKLKFEGNVDISNFKEGDKILITLKKYQGERTENQNKSLHIYFRLLAEALNDAGFDIKKTLKQDFDIPWTEISVKEMLWRPVQKSYLKKNSTTKLNKTQDIDKIYDIINRAIGEKTGVYVPWPCEDNLINK